MYLLSKSKIKKLRITSIAINAAGNNAIICSSNTSEQPLPAPPCDPCPWDFGATAVLRFDRGTNVQKLQQM